MNNKKHKKFFITRSNNEEHFCVCVSSSTGGTQSISSVTILSGASGDSGVSYDHVKRVLPGLDPTADTDERQDFGGTLLFDLGDNKYVFIGAKIVEFTIPDGDTILHYYSRVGHNGIPYPVAVGKINAYFMLDWEYVPISEFPEKCTQDDWCYGYIYFYGQHCENAKPMKGTPFPIQLSVIER